MENLTNLLIPLPLSQASRAVWSMHGNKEVTCLCQIRGRGRIRRDLCLTNKTMQVFQLFLGEKRLFWILRVPNSLILGWFSHDL